MASRRAPSAPVNYAPPPPLTAPEADETETVDFFEHLAQLPEDSKQIGKVYVYRLFPAIVNTGRVEAIDIVPAHLFSRDLLIEKHGGGKYQLWLNCKPNTAQIKRIVGIPGSAKIYPTHVLVGEDGNPLPTPAPAAAPPAAEPVTKDDMRSVIREVAAASKVGNDGAQSALAAAVELITTASKKSLEIVAGAQKGDDSGAVETLRKEVVQLRSDLSTQREQSLQAQIESLRAEIRAGSGKGKSGELGALSDTAETLGVEGGVVGLIQKVAGQASAKEEGLGETIAKGLVDLGKTFVEQNGGRLVDWLQQRTHVDYLKVVTQRQQAGLTDVPAPPAGSTPRQPATQQPAAPGPRLADQPAATEEEMNLQQTIAMLTQHVPETIFRFWNREFSGEATAEIVKENFKPFLPMLRAQFNDLEKLKALAGNHPVLKVMTEQADFDAWAADFFDEFQRLDDDEKPGASAAVN